MEQIVPVVRGLQFLGKFPEPFVDSIHVGKADVWFVKRIQQRLKDPNDGGVVDEVVISVQVTERFLQAILSRFEDNPVVIAVRSLGPRYGHA